MTRDWQPTNQWEKLHPPTPYLGSPVLSWPLGQPAPELPDGTAGIAVRILSRGTDSKHFDHFKAVGVDDQPLWHGLGRLVVVVEPGEHLVEVRGRFSAETTRLVRVHAGEIADLEYWVPASFFHVDGVLVRTPARHRPGGYWWSFLAMCVTFGGLFFIGVEFERPGPTSYAFAAAMLVAPVAALLLPSRVKRFLDQRYRTAVSYEAHGDTRAADRGMFLGDGACPPGLADESHGVLVVTGTAALEYVWNGRGLQPSTPDPNAWIRWPSLTIDGVERPFSWRTWCYRLPPGTHEVAVAARSPRPAEGQDPDRFATEPVTATVEIAAGHVTRLDVRVKATTEVRTTAPSVWASTVMTAFRATVDLKTRSPGD